VTRILALTNFYPPFSVGGDRSAADVLERLAARHHEVTVLTSNYRAPLTGADRSEPLADVHRHLRLYWRDHDVIVPPRSTRLWMEWSNRRALSRALARARPEVVCVWTMGAFPLGLVDQLRRSQVPIVYAVCNDWLVWGPGQDAWTSAFTDRPRLGRWVTALTGLATIAPDLGASGTFLFVSDWTRRHAEANSRWSFPDWAVVHSGIETAEFPPPGPQQPPAVDGEAAPLPWTWRLLYVGRLDPDKGAVTAVEALAHLPASATLDVIGPGHPQQRETLQSRAAELGVGERVSFGELPRSELAARYRRADVLVFPSRWQEPFGLTPLEAMACATPVVATGLGGSAEYLADGGNCLIVPPEQPTAMARAVIRLAEDADLRRRLVAGGLATAARFGNDALADRFERWLVAAAAGYTGGRPDHPAEQEAG
jgi:glycogen synthase